MAFCCTTLVKIAHKIQNGNYLNYYLPCFGAKTILRTAILGAAVKPDECNMEVYSHKIVVSRNSGSCLITKTSDAI